MLRCSSKMTTTLNGQPDRVEQPLPADVKRFLLQLFSECNRRISFQLCTFPNAHEEALNLLFISHFAHMQGAIKFGSGWTLRIDAHYIGGGRHYRTWEVADIGLMAMFRQKGRIVRSKLIFLQSKKLYARPLKFRPIDPYFRMGMGRLLVTESEHREMVARKILKYTESSKYAALQLKDSQHQAITKFSKAHDVPIHYLLYNPSLIPWEILSPVEQLPTVDHNRVGARVIPKTLLDRLARTKKDRYSPSYKDVKDEFGSISSDTESVGGWRMEHFICDQFIGGNEGLVDKSPNFEVMSSLMNQKSSPISSALSITFDYDETLLESNVNRLVNQ